MAEASWLTSRDFLLLQVINGYGLLTSTQIHKLVFPKTRKRTMLRRLRRLLKAKLIFYHDGLPKGERTWVLSPKGGKLLGVETTINTVNKNTLYHDAKVSDVRLALEKEGFGKFWQNGHVLKANATRGITGAERHSVLVPDSLFVAKQSDRAKNVALEVELKLKAKSRYQQNFEKYSNWKSLDYLWYVVPTKSFGEKLLSLFNKSPSASKDFFYWSLLRDVLDNPSSARLYGQNQNFLMDQFCQKNQSVASSLAPKPKAWGAHTGAHTVRALDLDISENDSLSN